MRQQTNRCLLALVFSLLPFGLMAATSIQHAQAAPARRGTQSLISKAVTPDPEPNALTPAEWIRLVAGETRLEQTLTLSDSDITFAAHMLRSKAPVNTPHNNFTRQRITLSELTASRPNHLTPVQRKRLFGIVLPYTGSANSVVQCNAILVLTSTHDVRGIPVLKHLTGSRRAPERCR